MPVAVKTHHIEINVKGDLPKNVISFLKSNFGNNFSISTHSEDNLINLNETEWYKKTKQKMSPAKYIKHLRESRGMTQDKLGKLLGGISRQNISNMESGKRGISKDKAIKLSHIFDMPLDRFLQV